MATKPKLRSEDEAALPYSARDVRNHAAHITNLADEDTTSIDARVRELAASFDCITEDDFRLLAGITHGTAEAWRRRGSVSVR